MASKFAVLLDTDVASEVTREALDALKDLFADRRGIGSQMAVRAAGPLATADEVAGSCAVLATDLLQAIAQQIGSER